MTLRRASRFLSIILATLSVNAAAEPAEAERKISAVEALFDRGETLEYSVSWMALAGGTATLSVSPENGQRYRIESLAQSSPSFARIYKVRDYIESLVERDTFSTVHYRKILQEKSRRKDVTTTFDYEKGIATRKGVEIPISKPLLDPLSTVFYVRKLDLQPGRTYRATIISDGKVYQPEIFVIKRERVQTEAGSFQTVMVEPKMKRGSLFREGDSRLFIWYTDDAAKIPVRIRTELSFGSITASLKSVRYASAPSPPVTGR